MKRFAALLACLCILSSIPIFISASENTSGDKPAVSVNAETITTPAPASPAAQSSPSDSLFPVMTVILVSWIGISLYLFRIDRRISKLEKELNE